MDSVLPKILSFQVRVTCYNWDVLDIVSLNSHLIISSWLIKQKIMHFNSHEVLFSSMSSSIVISKRVLAGLPASLTVAALYIYLNFFFKETTVAFLEVVDSVAKLHSLTAASNEACTRSWGVRPPRPPCLTWTCDSAKCHVCLCLAHTDSEHAFANRKPLASLGQVPCPWALIRSLVLSQRSIGSLAQPPPQPPPQAIVWIVPSSQSCSSSYFTPGTLFYLWTFTFFEEKSS